MCLRNILSFTELIILTSMCFFSPQATFKASKFAVSPDMNFVLLGYDVKQVRTAEYSSCNHSDTAVWFLGC